MVTKTDENNLILPLKERIVQKLDDLSETNLRKVLELVEQLYPISSNGDEDDPILAVAGTLSFPPLTNEQIDQELYGDFTIKENSY